MATEPEEEFQYPGWFGYTGIVFAVVFFGWLIYGTFGRSKAMSDHPRYTIGYVKKTGYVLGPSSHSETLFNYYVNGKEYLGGESGDLLTDDTRYLVKCGSQDPSFYDFYKKVPIPDSIKQAPPEGWETPPFPVTIQELTE